jgi:hypothetical protein
MAPLSGEYLEYFHPSQCLLPVPNLVQYQLEELRGAVMAYL